MIIFYTSATRHLAAHIKLPIGACTIQQFTDGELFVRIDQNVHKKTVWVIAATQAPAEHMLELFFMLDALTRAGAAINLMVTYFGYARQIIAAPGEACAAQVIATLLQTFSTKQRYVIHPHSPLLHSFFSYSAIEMTDFFCKQAASYDALAAPDKGAFSWAQEIAKLCNKELIILTKRRPKQEQVEILTIDGNVRGKKILLIDDIISTGYTITKAATALKELGATSIAAAITHGIFSPGSYALVQQSPLETVFVTNTVAQQPHNKISVIDIGPHIEKIILTTSS